MTFKAKENFKLLLTKTRKHSEGKKRLVSAERDTGRLQRLKNFLEN